MRNMSWDEAKAILANLEPAAVNTIDLVNKDIKLYPRLLDEPEKLSQLLANINYYVLRLGELHGGLEQVKLWTEKRYDIEKGLAVVKIVRDEKKAVNYADNAKYEIVQQYLDTMVNARALYTRVQNARSSARDVTEAIRSRISQIKGAVRSS